jgi:diguanylate cyclase (GGDEF)-like protein/putative nucleotidyltransferase with HDIG domain
MLSLKRAKTQGVVYMSGDIQQLITKEINLPSPPAVAVQILSTVQNENSDFSKLTKIIASDPALTAKMLQIANSGFYALQKKVTSIDRALTVLGTNIIKNIALSFVITTEMRTQNSSGFDINKHWRHSVTTAVAAELLANQLGQKNEDIFATALLHNIGMPVISAQRSDKYSQIVKTTEPTSHEIVNEENQAFGFDHQQVGALLIKHWGLPERVAEPIKYHHCPDSAPDKFQLTAHIISFAERIASIYTGSECAVKVRELQSDLFEHFCLDENSVRSLLDQVAENSIEILNTFEIDPGDMRPYSQLLQEANEELGKLNLSYEQLVIELKEAKEKSERLAKELGDANSRLNNLVYTDSLTGLYNHRYFQENLTIELSRAHRYNFSVSLIVFDIDYFKKVNDTYGHPAGDQVLKNIANAIKATIRPSDIVARYGGEEFAVILPQTDISGIKIFAARIRRCVEGVITEYEDKKIMVTISLGGTTFSPNQPEITKDVLFETADRALYISKNNGRNQVTILATENTPKD